MTEYREIDPRDIIVAEGFNQRVDFGDIDELAAQIKEQGLLEPVSVVEAVDEAGKKQYILINGERRYRAIMSLIEEGYDVGLIKAGILPADMKDDELFIQQFMRNEGKKFNDVELGRICKKLEEKGYSRSEIAKMLGKNPGVITYALQSLSYAEPIRQMIEDGKIGGTEVRRVYTAARKTYGDDWEEKANQEIIAKKKEAEKANDEKVSIKRKKGIGETDLYGDVKDTKTFMAGIKVFLQYIAHYERASGKELEIDLYDIYLALKDDDKATLRSVLEKSVSEGKATA